MTILGSRANAETALGTSSERGRVLAGAFEPAWSSTLGATPTLSPWLWGLITALAAAIAALWIMGVVKPGGLCKHQRDVKALPWWLWACGGVMIIAGQVVGSGIGRLFVPTGADAIRSLAITQIAGHLAAIVAGVLLLQVTSRASPNAGLRLRWGDFHRGVIAFFLVVPFVLVAGQASAIVYRWTQGAPPDPVGHQLLAMYQDNPSNPSVWALLGAAVLLVPVVEELVYRVFLQSGFLRLLGRRWAAVASASIVFAAMHHLPGENGPAVPWHMLPSLLALSLGMGIAFERTGRLGVPIVMHVLFNGANVGLMVWSMRR